MSQMIRQLLYLSSAMETGKGDDVEPIAWRQFLTPFADDRVTLKVETASDPVVEANPYLLKMATENIVRNALKYSEKPVVITLSDRQLTVSDEGIGIPRKELSLILQPFYRASNTRSYQGGGIGMSLSARIFKLYGIRMQVKSKENVGTTVVLEW